MSSRVRSFRRAVSSRAWAPTSAARFSPAGAAACLLAGWMVGGLACSNSSSDPGEGTAGGGTGGTEIGGTTHGGAGDPSSPQGGTTGGGAAVGGTSNGGGIAGGGAAVGGTSTGGTSNGGAGDGGATNGDPTGGDTTTGDTTSDDTPPSGACDASSPPAIQRLGLETVVQSSDFRVLVYAAQPPGSDDWYLVDALGYVRVYSNGVLQETPFLDVSSEVQNSGFGSGTPEGGVQNYDERGLLGIAFPPDYATSGKFYVTLIPTTTQQTDPEYDLEDHDLVLEYTRSTGNPLVADPSTRKEILRLERGGEGYTRGNAVFSYAKYHNGSTVLFGPDGMLYLGMGDGGGDCNAAWRGAPQDVSSPYGKILRLDPNAEPPYAAAGNPFVEGGDARVFHYGLRNPFRFSFDSLTGDLYIGEVGQWTNDWISYAPAGAQGVNFGWPSYEGVTANPRPPPMMGQTGPGMMGQTGPGICDNATPLRSGSTRSDPIFNLSHGGSAGANNLTVAIVGGAVYRGSAIPELRGAYLFGEFYPSRPMRAMYHCGEETSEVTVIQKRCDPNTPDVACFLPPSGASQELRQVGAIVEGHDGELYIPANGNTLLKIVPAP